jgi:hypothetical protein
MSKTRNLRKKPRTKFKRRKTRRHNKNVIMSTDRRFRLLSYTAKIKRKSRNRKRATTRIQKLRSKIPHRSLLRLFLNPIYTNTSQLNRVCRYVNSNNLFTKSMLIIKFSKFRRFYRFKKNKIAKKKLFKMSHISATLTTKYHTINKAHRSNTINNLRKTKTNPNSRFKLPVTSLRCNNLTKKFSFSYVSLFLKFRLSLNNLSHKSEKFLIRKALFSFLKPNESKKSIMTRRRKIRTYRFYRSMLISPSSNKLYTSKLKNNQLLSNVLVPSTTFLPMKTSFRKKSTSELFLPRVKFKPGYQRI